jgi:hypothetical protein
VVPRRSESSPPKGRLRAVAVVTGRDIGVAPWVPPPSIFRCDSTAWSSGSSSCTTDVSSPRLAAANCSLRTAPRSASETVAALKVAKDIDFWNAAISFIPKSAGGWPATAPTATMRPFGLSLSKNDAMPSPATTSMTTS